MNSILEIHRFLFGQESAQNSRAPSPGSNCSTGVLLRHLSLTRLEVGPMPVSHPCDFFPSQGWETATLIEIKTPFRRQSLS